jgi:nitroreductase
MFFRYPETTGGFMEFTELIHARHSVRSFRPEPVSDEAIAQIIEAVRSAPSAGNFQAYELYLVRGAARMAALAAATFNHAWIAEAPCALVVCTHAARCQYQPPEHWATQDAAIAATFAHLAITEAGLATCWVGAFLPANVAQAIEAADGHTPLAILPIGDANAEPLPTTRREVEEFVHRRE